MVEVSIYGESEDRAERSSASVLNEFDRLHHKFHAWQPSMLTALNDSIARGEPFQADAEMVGLLKSATMLAERSDNLFNPGDRPSDPAVGLPEQRHHAARTAAPRKSGAGSMPIRACRDLRYARHHDHQQQRAVMIDLGGYAKGYALDRAAQLLRAAHVKAALINVGGNVLAIGQPGDAATGKSASAIRAAKARWPASSCTTMKRSAPAATMSAIS